MSTAANARVQKVTSELSDEFLREQHNRPLDITYHPIPSGHMSKGEALWRVRLDMTHDSQVQLGLDIHEDVVLGREQELAVFGPIYATFDPDRLGISRQHALLRPTETHLYVIDLGSTNGTWLNGNSIGVNMPYSINNHDLVRLGRLEFTVNFVKQPLSQPAPHTPVDLADALTQIAQSITSQLDQESVLKAAMDMITRYTPSNDISIWLVDEQSGELFLEAGRGDEEAYVRRVPASDPLAWQVIQTGKAVRSNRGLDGAPVKNTAQQVMESILHVPLTLGGTAFGALSATYRKPGRSFTANEEKVLLLVSDLTAIAIQNARQHHATARAAARRAKIVTALNVGLSLDMKNLVKSTIGYTSLLRDSEAISSEIAEIAAELDHNGNQMAFLTNKLIEITHLSQELTLSPEPVDICEVVTSAVDDYLSAAASKGIQLDFQVAGTPCLIQGDASLIYRSALNLVDNAVKFTPPGGRVAVIMVFNNDEIVIRVQDTGPGIPEEDLPMLFEQYYRSASTDGRMDSGGLGLEFVRATAEAHRGIVTARNLEDGGAEFIVAFPGRLRV